MKVHLNQEPRCALVWNFGPDRPGFGILELAARQYKLRLRAVGEAELGATVGNLVAGRPGKPMPEAVSLPDRAALIVSGLRTDDGSLNVFLDTLRRGGADIPLRAMVTPTSRGWTLGALLHELNAEHEAIGGGA